MGAGLACGAELAGACTNGLSVVSTRRASAALATHTGAAAANTVHASNTLALKDFNMIKFSKNCLL
jgi:hypothetical protein